MPFALLIIIIICLVAPLVWGITHMSLTKNYGWGWDHEGVIIGYTITIAPCLMAFVAMTGLVYVSTGEKVYTGYIYSSEDSYNRTIGHIRFSETAGEDSQPAFCAVKGSEDG